MHIPDSMLQGRLCPVTAALAAVGLLVAAVFAARSRRNPGGAAFGAVTALIFAGQMMNFPIRDGTSGHLLGGVLASALLGTPFGVLSVAIVVSLQCLLFSDGGITVLGANLLNMAIFGAGAGGLLRNALLAGHATSARRTLATGLAAWVSIQLAALAVCLQLALNGQVAFSRVLPAMMGTHAWIGIGEAVLTLAVCAVAAGYPARSPARAGRGAATLCAAGLIALVLSPFASGSPDGLEWVAAKLAFLHEAVPVFAGPFVGYSVPAVASEALSTGLAGLIGVLASFTGAWLFLFVTRLGERQTVRI